MLQSNLTNLTPDALLIAAIKNTTHDNSQQKPKAGNQLTAESTLLVNHTSFLAHGKLSVSYSQPTL